MPESEQRKRGDYYLDTKGPMQKKIEPPGLVQRRHFNQAEPVAVDRAQPGDAPDYRIQEKVEKNTDTENDDDLAPGSCPVKEPCGRQQ